MKLPLIRRFELKGFGRNTKAGPIVQFCAGEGVSHSHSEELAGYFLKPRYGILHEYEQRFGPDPSFVEELKLRGYDLSTFRFSLFRFEANRKLPKVIPVIKQKPGVLLSRWARVPHDTPDICSSWGVPARRADSHLYQSLLSSTTYDEAQMNVRLTARLEKRGYPWVERSLLTVIKELGFDIRTLRFSVKHTGKQESE